MTKISKSSPNMLILALALSVLVVASVFATRSTVTVRASSGEPMSSVKPIKGVDVIVQENPGCCRDGRQQTDAEGSFTVTGSDLTPGTYQVSLVCNAKCQSMNDLGAGVIQFTLTGAKESPFKRGMSKQQLVGGVKFSIEIAGRKGEPKTLTGIVSLVK